MRTAIPQVNANERQIGRGSGNGTFADFKRALQALERRKPKYAYRREKPWLHALVAKGAKKTA